MKSRSKFKEEIDRNKRMEAITLNIDKAINKIKDYQRDKKVKPKRGFRVTTSNALFKQDMKWLRKANPIPFKNQEKYEEERKLFASKMRERRLKKQELIMTGKSL